ncbi:MAG: ABC transporter ATP-binding protein [Anaerolineae bacterium]
MAETVIKVENLSKRFAINAGLTSDTLRGQVTQSLRGLFNRRQQPIEGEDFIWALRDVSFEIKQGEVIGIVGQNGSGKSTLLKILSRISPPTRGRVEITGRVASLLEVGTGFHPELTGRENVYMNAAILGMRRDEIRRKFDEIVEFAEVARFIDTPIKHYSSGMYMRLAFSVAAHLEQEILVVDEVLAVGDASFQQKSLGKMDEVAHQGRTVLFVSHNMGALTTLCPRSILLVRGQKMLDSDTHTVVQEYVKSNTVTAGERHWSEAEAPGSEKVRLRSVRVLCDGQVTADVDIQKDTQIEFTLWNDSPGEQYGVGMTLIDQVGVEVLTSANLPTANLVDDPGYDVPLPVGEFKATVTLPANFLNTGRYSLHLGVTTDVTRPHIYEKHVIYFTVYESGKQEFMGNWPGVIRPRLAWKTHHLETNNV